MKTKLKIDEKYLDYLDFKNESISIINGSEFKYKFKFPNGYVASVIKNSTSKGHENDLFEVAIYENGELIKDSVKGYVNNDDVMSFLDYVLRMETWEIQKNIEEFVSLLRSTEREGIDNLIYWLNNATDFFTSPASTKYHLAEKGGLLKHSLNVYNQLIKELAVDTPAQEEIPEELISSAVVVSLLHDICKANFYSVKNRNVKNELGKWETEPYYVVDDQFPIGHGEKSIILIQKFIKLSDDEIMAIRWHMGGFESKDNYQYVSNAFSKCSLALLLHIADMKATYIDENK